jgi:uncharacterized protein YcaQ
MPSDPKPVETLSKQEARAIILRAQGLAAEPAKGETVASVLRRLGCIQLDTISVLARAHELAAYARLGPVPRAEIEAAYWSAPSQAFEYIAHAACVIPIELWPYFAFRRRAIQDPGDRRAPQGLIEEARARLEDGPMAVTEGAGLGAPSERGGWLGWSEGKMALESLYRRGEAAVTTRRGWTRVYDLPERVVPAELLARDPSDEECYLELVRVTARALGVGTAGDIADYFRLTTPYLGAAPDARRLVRTSIEAAGLAPVRVEGWPEPALADPAALSEESSPPGRVTLVSPFDPLIWASARPGESKERERTRRVFDFTYAFEAYVRPEQRRFGYYSMPLLNSGRLAGHVDPRREGDTLVAARVSLEGPDDLEAMAAALREAAAWVGCADIRVDRVTPEEFAAPLSRLVA